jgi:glutathione S-transferase
MYTLYGFPFSQHSRRVVSLLEAAGLDYQFKLVDLLNGEHMSADFLRLNPNHQVPTLVSPNLTLHESNAIMRYLCNKHRLDTWYPPEADHRAKVDQWLDWIQCRMSPAVVDIVLNQVFLGDKGDQEAIQRGKESLFELAQILEDALSKAPYIAGQEASIADLALASNIFQLGFANEIPTGTSLQQWYKCLLTLAPVQASLPAD